MKLNAASVSAPYSFPSSTPSHGMMDRSCVVNRNLEARVAPGPGALGCLVTILLEKWVGPRPVGSSKGLHSGSLLSFLFF